MDRYTLFIIIVVAGLSTIIFIVSKMMNQKSSQLSEPEKPKEAELTERFYMGQYLGGLPETKDKAPLVFCGVTQDSFIFCKGTRGAEIGRIPRDSIKNISISPGNEGPCITINWSKSPDAVYATLFYSAQIN